MSQNYEYRTAQLHAFGCLANLFMLPFMIIGQLLQWALLLLMLPFFLLAALFGKKG